MRLVALFLLVLGLIGQASHAPSKPPPEDPRQSFINGLLIQLYSRAQSDRQIDDQGLYDAYKDRFITQQAYNEADDQYAVRLKKYRMFVKDILLFARNHVSPDLLFKKFRLGVNEEIAESPNVVVWEVSVPDGVKTDIAGDPRHFNFLFFLIDKPRPADEKVEKGNEEWRIYEIRITDLK